jgi:hypothetical protein
MTFVSFLSAVVVYLLLDFPKGLNYKKVLSIRREGVFPKSKEPIFSCS